MKISETRTSTSVQFKDHFEQKGEEEEKEEEEEEEEEGAKGDKNK